MKNQTHSEIPLHIHYACMLSHFSCVRLYDPIDGSPPGSPVPGIFQARILEWVTISFTITFTKMVIITNVDKDMEKQELSYTTGGNVK